MKSLFTKALMIDAGAFVFSILLVSITDELLYKVKLFRMLFNGIVQIVFNGF